MGSPSNRRDYKKEYKDFHGKNSQIEKRSARNKARRAAKKSGSNVAGKDVGHVSPLKNRKPKGKGGATKVQSVRANRAHGGRISSGTKGKKLNRRK